MTDSKSKAHSRKFAPRAPSSGHEGHSKFEKYHFKGTMKRPMHKWGEILTADHLVSRTAQKKDRSGWEGYNVAKNALNIKDLYSTLIHCSPVWDKG